MSNRVFLVSNDELKIFHWKGVQLERFYQFSSSDADLDAFREYLTITQNQSCQILLDVLEEDFQIEQIPHVTGKDRKVLTDRAINRHYRDSKYVHWHQIGRLDKGRKDDEILISSISSTDPLDLWLNIIHATKTPVMGIWSLPIVGEKLIQKLKKLELGEDVILISKQMASTQRESYIRKGKMIVSRQVRIQAQSGDTSGPESTAVKLTQFLRNKRYLGFGKKVDLVYLMPFELIAEASGTEQISDEFNYHYLVIDDIASMIGIKLTDDSRITLYSHPEAILAFLCSELVASTNHYAPDSDRTAYFKKKANQVLSYLTYLGSLALFSLTALFSIISMNYISQSQESETLLMKLDQEYQDKYFPIIDQINNAESMRSYVEFVEQLKQEAKQSPETFFGPLSTVMSNRYFSAIHITGFRWEKLHAEELTNFIKELEGTEDGMSGGNFTDPFGPLTEGRTPILHIEGKLDQAEEIYRNTVVIMDEFVRNIEALDAVKDTWVKRVPVDIRETSNYSGQTGSVQAEDMRRDDAEKFEIVIRLMPTKITSADQAGGHHE